MERRRFLTLAGSALVVAACDGTAPDTLPPASTTPSTRTPSSALVTRWATDPYSRGSYSYLATGSTPADRDALRADVDDRLFFAGEATSTAFPATAHGALLEGRDAARRVSSVIGLASNGGTPPDESVVVIGAGIAGLGAAQALAENGHRVTVIEARNRIGGRIHTDTIGSQTVDLGASWIHGVDGNPLVDLAEQAAIDLQGTDDDSIVVRDVGGLTIDEDTIDAMRQRLRRALDDSADESVGQALEGVIQELSDDERRILRYVVTSEIEHEFGADALRLALGALDEGEEYLGGDAVVPHGFRQLLGPLLDGYEIRTATPVSRITHGTSGVEVTTTGGESISADRVVVTVPLGVLQADAIEFAPALPDSKQAAIDRLGMAVLEKVVLQFETPFWDDADLLGFVGTEPGRFVEWLNLLPLAGSAVLVGFNAGSIAENLIAGSDTAVVAAASDALSAMYP